MASAKAAWPCVGIDLGNAKSCVAIWDEDRAKILTKKNGISTIPPFISFADNQMLVGYPAKLRQFSSPENTICNFKHFVGQKFSQLEPKTAKRMYTVAAAEDDSIKIHVNNQELSPEWFYSAVIKELIQDAEEKIGTTIRDAVLTVPNYFSYAQRLAVKEACLAVGLKVHRIINDSTSAALSFAFSEGFLTSDEKNVLIFDLGVYACNVTLVTFDEGVIEVRTSAGTSCVGGEYFNDEMVKFFSQQLKKPKRDISNEVLCQLRNACELAKTKLSKFTDASIVHNSTVFGSINRSQFEDMNAGLFQSCLELIEHVLRESRIDKQQIHHVVLIGGSSHIPKIQQLLQDFFGDDIGITNQSHNLEHVAAGAAVSAAILAAKRSAQLDKIVLLDAMSLSIGVETTQGGIYPLVPPRCTIPVNRREDFTTAIDTNEVAIRLYEGESPLAKDNRHLYDLMMPLSPQPRGLSRVQVTCDVDFSGIITVSALDTATNISKSIQLNHTSLIQRNRVQMHTPVLHIIESDNAEEFSDLTELTLEQKLENSTSEVARLTQELVLVQQKLISVENENRVLKQNIANGIPFTELTIGEKIGEGAFGEIFRARWHGQSIVIKKLREGVVPKEKAFDIENEARTLMHLRHEHIVLSMGVTTNPETGEAMLVMEFMKNGSLDNLLFPKDPVGQKLARSDAIQIALDVAKGLNYLHSLTPKIIHRDLKSANILLHQNRKRAKICDFGIARYLNPTSAAKTVIGTLGFMAPEVLAEEEYDEKADVFSFGVVLYEMNTNNRLPTLEEKNRNKRIRDKVKDAEFQQLILNCCKSDPSERLTIRQCIEVLKRMKKNLL